MTESTASTGIVSSAVSVDAVVLRVSEEGTAILVHRRGAEPFTGEWALPGVLLGAGERISDAAIRAAGKAGVTAAEVTGVGQLVVFDEPHRDPRGPTLSISAWVAVGEHRASEAGASAAGEESERWVEWDALPPLAFDHARILADVRPVLAEKLWRDLTFTASLLGREFSVRTALAVTASLTGDDVDRGNLNRTLKRIAVRSDVPGPSGVGRPGAMWTWP
ncbi:NUDIX hydrolase [Gordonia spumicola]|uniref:NUDIX hydrolase n=1 Tax=Gordonia spumicola TaxID=589161 RepID=A0A7I9VEI3_9ACTN|nr:NUDIX domain-containing protein [Gordonia spumicola]GEE03737.1 NUDIX hydrolase [Gordonia spumicola]